MRISNKPHQILQCLYARKQNTSRLTRVSSVEYMVYALIASMLMSCAAPQSQRADGGMTGTGKPLIAIGAVSGFGSVIVNGRRFDTSDAQVFINGRRARASDLQVGMVIRVEGTQNEAASEARARIVGFESDVTGPIQSVTPAGGGALRLKVFGQEVVLTSSTALAGWSAISALRDGEGIDVSGYRDQRGVRFATFARRADPTLARLKGTLANLTGSTFSIGTQAVDFAAARVSQSGNAQLVNGAFAAIEGRLKDGRFVASRVDVRPLAVSFPENSAVSMEGLIQRMLPQGFTMHNRPIEFSAATRFERTQADALGADQRVFVEGVYRGGALAAARVVNAAP
jgi:hypothetical protein